MRFAINTRPTNTTRLTCLCRLLRTVWSPIDLTTKDNNHCAQHDSPLPDIELCILLVLSLKVRFTSSKIIYQKNVGTIIFWTKITKQNVVMKILVNFGVRKSLKHNFWIALRYFLGSVSKNKNPYYFPTHGYPPCLSVLHPLYPFPKMLFKTNLYKPRHT